MNLNLINPLHGPHAYETTSHILFECPGFDRKRDKLLPPKPDIHNTLYGPLKQLRLTANFIRLALADKSEQLVTAWIATKQNTKHKTQNTKPSKSREYVNNLHDTFKTTKNTNKEV